MDQWLSNRKSCATNPKTAKSSCVFRPVLFLHSCTLNSLLRILAQSCCYKQGPFKGHPMWSPLKGCLSELLSSHGSIFISASTPTCFNSVHDPDFKRSRVNILDCWPKCGRLSWAHAFLLGLAFVVLMLSQAKWTRKKTTEKHVLEIMHGTLR